MGFARAADVPVVLIGDIDRGGVIASIVGTKAVIAPEDAALICGFIVNKFRGDPGAVRRRHGARSRSATGWPALGLVPYLRRCASVAGRRCARRSMPAHGRRKPMRASASRSRSCRTSPISTISIRWRPNPLSSSCACAPGAALPGDADLVILPGSKATIADLDGFARRRLRHRYRRASAARRNDLGLCGGYQMLGRTIADPDGIEGPPAPSKVSVCSTSQQRCPMRSALSR